MMKKIKKKEGRQYEIESKALLDDAIKQINIYKQNMFKAYLFLWEKCSKAM